jgi:hypothetical protein
MGAEGFEFCAGRGDRVRGAGGEEFASDARQSDSAGSPSGLPTVTVAA